MTRAVSLTDSYVHLLQRGNAEVLPRDGLGTTTPSDDTVTWDPSVAGLLVGEASMSESSRHGGERHLDSDELVYLVSGAVRVCLETQGAEWTEVPLQAGDAVVVPQGVWHRLLVDEPSRMLFLSGGRTEVRVRSQPR